MGVTGTEVWSISVAVRFSSRFKPGSEDRTSKF
jgi:hypothetical protein